MTLDNPPSLTESSSSSETEVSSSPSETEKQPEAEPGSDHEVDATLSPNERKSIGFTVGFAVISLTAAVFTSSWSLLVFHALAMGALGGLTHEFAQSGGKIFFFRKTKDGLYLGSMTGMVLGMVAGLLVARSYIQPQPNSVIVPDQNQVQNTDPVKPFDIAISLEIFFAALGLKGVAEAATDQPPANREE